MEEEGCRAGYCTKESVPHCVQIIPPKLWKILLPVQMFQFECLLASFGCLPVPHLQYQGSAFGTTIAAHRHAEESNELLC